MKIPVNLDPEEVPTAKDEQFKERLHHLKIVAEKQPQKEEKPAVQDADSFMRNEQGRDREQEN